MDTSHDLEKSIWTDKDFETMGWHDNSIHAIGLLKESLDEPELVLDIDYITEWLDATPPSPYMEFYIAPSTLVFHTVFDLKINMSWYYPDLRIDDITYINREPPYQDSDVKAWLIQCDVGEIEFISSGFTQYMRQQPRWHPHLHFKVSERGGLSFERKAYYSK